MQYPFGVSVAAALLDIVLATVSGLDKLVCCQGQVNVPVRSKPPNTFFFTIFFLWKVAATQPSEHNVYIQF